jgi:hypothetical protein
VTPEGSEPVYDRTSPLLKLDVTDTLNRDNEDEAETVSALSTTTAGLLLGTEMADDVPLTAVWLKEHVLAASKNTRAEMVFMLLDLDKKEPQCNCKHLEGQ